jgi:hypothetical protein
MILILLPLAAVLVVLGLAELLLAMGLESLWSKKTVWAALVF